MIKTLFLVFLGLINVINYKTCQSKEIKEFNKNNIIWSESRKLKWEDFKAIKPFISNFSAASSVQLKVDYILGDSLKKFDVVCFFKKEKSWTMDTSNYGLKHEQIHFDIGEIQARLLRSAIIENKNKLNRWKVRLIDSLVHYYTNKLIASQKLYDSLTLHSQNQAEQQIWNSRIANELDSLKNYARQ